jgi:hypothetical protein
VRDNSYVAVLLALVVLAGIAAWQFYSLAWGDPLGGGYIVDRSGKNLPDDPARRPMPAVSPK